MNQDPTGMGLESLSHGHPAWVLGSSLGTLGTAGMWNRTFVRSSPYALSDRFLRHLGSGRAVRGRAAVLWRVCVSVARMVVLLGVASNVN